MLPPLLLIMFLFLFLFLLLILFLILFLFLCLFLFLILFLFLFLFLLLHANGVMASYLFPAVVIDAMASSIATDIVLSNIIPQMETKMAPTTKTVATMNETRHGALSTLPSYSRPRESEGGGCHCWSWW